MEKFIIDAVKGFTVANLGNEKTLGFLLSSFGQRYLTLNKIGNTETDEFKNLEELFDILHLTPKFSDKYGVIFYKKPAEEVKDKQEKSFFAKRNTKSEEKNGSKTLINDIFWDMKVDLISFLQGLC